MYAVRSVIAAGDDTHLHTVDSNLPQNCANSLRTQDTVVNSVLLSEAAIAAVIARNHASLCTLSSREADLNLSASQQTRYHVDDMMA